MNEIENPDSYKVSEQIQQKLDELIGLPQVKKGMEFIQGDEENFIEELIDLVKIEAPTFHEEQRARVMVKKFETMGLKNVCIDKHGNVSGVLPGSRKGYKGVVVDAHMDTVYPFGTVKTVFREENILKAPGICDDTRGLATQLALIKAFNSAGVRPVDDIIFLCSVREESPGVLGGMRDYLNDNVRRVKALISIDGDRVEEIIYRATGMLKAQVTFYGEQTHPAINIANSLHACSRAVAKIADLPIPAQPWLSYNVTDISPDRSAGKSIVPPKTSFEYSIRTNCAKEMEKIDNEILCACEDAAREETERWGKNKITWDREVFFHSNPNCSQSEHSPLLESVYSILEHLGYAPRFALTGTTNASEGIIRGIPAVCVGMNTNDIAEETFMSNLHNPSEQTYIKNAYKGIQMPWLVTLMCAGVDGAFQPVL